MSSNRMYRCYIRLSSEDNDVDGSIKPKVTVSVHREC